MGLISEIVSKGIVVSDGAMGTMLQARGMPLGTCPEMMNIDMPGVVKGITVEYLRAGARLVETNTFGGNRFILGKYGLTDRLVEINAAGVKLAREAVEECRDVPEAEVFVFASLGPSGEFLEPLGNLKRHTLSDAVTEQVRAFKDAGADGVCVETLSDITEAEICIRAVKNAGLECIALMCFEPSPRGFYTMMGVNISQAVKPLIDAGSDAIGAGCGVGSAKMLEIAREIRSITGHPLAIHPNAGRPEYKRGKTIYPETPEDMARNAVELARIGVNIIGGCCGTTPAHIAAMYTALRSGFPT